MCRGVPPPRHAVGWYHRGYVCGVFMGMPVDVCSACAEGGHAGTPASVYQRACLWGVFMGMPAGCVCRRGNIVACLGASVNADLGLL